MKGIKQKSISKRTILILLFEGWAKVIKKDFTDCQSTGSRGKKENCKGALFVNPILHIVENTFPVI